MNQDTRNDLINALAGEFKGHPELKLHKENYITDTGAVDCTAMGVPLENLRKTKAVIEQHEEKYMKDTNNPMASQYLIHLRIAKKCVEEIISQKLKA
ncbi:MAG: hypothetical protein K6F37_01725 [Lachnospiraceae bacterium]|nr:hypothetical protein [Lachnospiraceae bacterium]